MEPRPNQIEILTAPAPWTVAGWTADGAAERGQALLAPREGPSGEPGEGSLPAELAGIDPYEIAFLRRGGQGVFELRLFDLTQRGYIEIVEMKEWLRSKRLLSIAPNHPPREDLSLFEDVIFDALVARPSSLDEITLLMTRQDFQSGCSVYRSSLQERGLISRLPKTASFLVCGSFLVACVLLGSWWPLVFGVGVALAVAVVDLRKRRRYIKDLRAKLAHLKGHPFSARLGIADPVLITLVAVFGTDVLAGSPYDAFASTVGPDSGGISLEIGGDGCGADGCGGCGGCA